jgi:hypothetical protein
VDVKLGVEVWSGCIWLSVCCSGRYFESRSAFSDPIISDGEFLCLDCKLLRKDSFPRSWLLCMSLCTRQVMDQPKEWSISYAHNRLEDGVLKVTARFSSKFLNYWFVYWTQEHQLVSVPTFRTFQLSDRTIRTHKISPPLTSNDALTL